MKEGDSDDKVMILYLDLVKIIEINWELHMSLDDSKISENQTRLSCFNVKTNCFILGKMVVRAKLVRLDNLR